jgi:hypothetical protein
MRRMLIGVGPLVVPADLVFADNRGDVNPLACRARGRTRAVVSDQHHVGIVVVDRDRVLVQVVTSQSISVTLNCQR